MPTQSSSLTKGTVCILLVLHSLNVCVNVIYFLVVPVLASFSAITSLIKDVYTFVSEYFLCFTYLLKTDRQITSFLSLNRHRSLHSAATMTEEYIKSIIDECVSFEIIKHNLLLFFKLQISAAVPEKQQVVSQLIDLSEPSVPFLNPMVVELKQKRDELK